MIFVGRCKTDRRRSLPGGSGDLIAWQLLVYVIAQMGEWVLAVGHGSVGSGEGVRHAGLESCSFTLVMEGYYSWAAIQ